MLYPHPTQNTYDVKSNELEALVEPDELESPLPTLEVPQELQYPYQPSLTQNAYDAKLDELEALPTLEVPQEPAKPDNMGIVCTPRRKLFRACKDL